MAHLLLFFFLMSVTNTCTQSVGELGGHLIYFGLEQSGCWAGSRLKEDTHWIISLVRLMYTTLKRHDRYTAQRAWWSTPADIERFFIFNAILLNLTSP